MPCNTQSHVPCNTAVPATRPTRRTTLRQLSTWHCPHLLLSAVLRHIALGSNRSLSPAQCTPAAQQQTRSSSVRMMGQTDRRPTVTQTPLALPTTLSASLTTHTLDWLALVVLSISVSGEFFSLLFFFLDPCTQCFQSHLPPFL